MSLFNLPQDQIHDHVGDTSSKLSTVPWWERRELLVVAVGDYLNTDLSHQSPSLAVYNPCRQR